MGGVVSCSRLELSLGGVKAQLESRDLRMRRVLWPCLPRAIIGVPGRIALELEL